MRAVGYAASPPDRSAEHLVDLDLPRPQPAGRDLLVRVEAVSINPVDTKQRGPVADASRLPRILGFDAAGTVEAVGEDATLFRPGDAVFYAGAVDRPGSNQEYQLVDERLVARKPTSLDFADAAALPLTAITAWETLFDRFRIQPDLSEKGTLLVIGAAGGVGSIATQIARELTGLTVVGTASREETRAFALDHGCHHVVDHAQPMAPQIEALGLGPVDYVFGVTQTPRHMADIGAMIRPFGHLCVIDSADLDLAPIRTKSVSLHFEYMFTRPVFQTADMIEQHRLLAEVSRLVDAGRIRTTRTRTLSPITAETVREAHRLVETGRTLGKTVIAGWPATPEGAS
ncbi:zinc-binding alcohol dehydrogenase family protein [Aureimonas sp. Leaf324]|jgi:zinc-binding alcohol dehydrogenase family protein|uniref:zinc-binding alcohol dehydrogenase family protein n=1 Tax=Aureimonas sp. Leaf324 TaxID=1736336 RepID=UPI0006F7DE76|nr:zinc-binding alcohol dehydrogenase family protein [Aureimonas sp. Leaf324]KQQ79559.1 NADPH:quinone reductase [Aureimonas sp. Leaf324]